MSNVVLPKTNQNAEYTENVGSLLKSTRLKRGISLQDVSQKTYIKLHYLQALEDDRFDILPAPVYTSGYIRQYAKLLGLEGNILVQRYHQQSSNPTPAPVSHTPNTAYSGLVGSPLERPMPVERPMVRHHEMEQIRLPAPRTTVEATTATIAPPPITEASPRVAPISRPVPAAGLPQADTKAAQDILDNARKEALLFRQNAEQYADQVLGQLEEDLRKTVAVLKNGRTYLKNRLDSYR